MTNDPDVIFTYGTLRPGLGDRPEAQAFRATARHLGPATFQGQLYAIDWYPAAIDSNDPSDIIFGDLFEIGKAPDFFNKLDTYEGCSPAWPQPYEYIRVVRQVTFQTRIIPAWVYLFNWQITDQARIRSGDFSDHVSGSR